MNAHDLNLLDRAEGFRPTAPASRQAARAAQLDRRADAVGRIEDELMQGFARALAGVTLTGDGFDDRQALERAAETHARTCVGWDRSFLADIAESAVDAVLA